MSSCLKINNTISQRGGDVAQRYSSCMEFFFKGTLASRPYCKISHQSINYGSIHKESLEIIHELCQVDSSEDVSFQGRTGLLDCLGVTVVRPHEG